MHKKLTEAQVKEINHLYWVKNLSAKEIAKRYPIIPNYVQKVAQAGRPKNFNVISFKNHCRKLSIQQVRVILVKIMNGALTMDLAEEYNVSKSNISNIKYGKTWKHAFRDHCKEYGVEIISPNGNTTRNGKKVTPWKVEIEAMPKDDNVIGHFVMGVDVLGISQQSAIAIARKKIMAAKGLNGLEYRTRTISCDEQKA